MCDTKPTMSQRVYLVRPRSWRNGSGMSLSPDHCCYRNSLLHLFGGICRNPHGVLLPRVSPRDTTGDVPAAVAHRTAPATTGGRATTSAQRAAIRLVGSRDRRSAPAHDTGERRAVVCPRALGCPQGRRTARGRAHGLPSALARAHALPGRAGCDERAARATGGVRGASLRPY